MFGRAAQQLSAARPPVEDDLPTLFDARPSGPLNGIDHFRRLDLTWMLAQRDQ
ncbi:hypothetical protein AB0J27_13265 [Micromonospora chokoriensis]